jgi:hypothetical protein
MKGKSRTSVRDIETRVWVQVEHMERGEAWDEDAAEAMRDVKWRSVYVNRGC